MNNLTDPDNEMIRYEQQLADHKLFCRHQERVFLKVIGIATKYLTPEQLNKFNAELNSEQSKTESMDAPNKPGYYRANND